MKSQKNNIQKPSLPQITAEAAQKPSLSEREQQVYYYIVDQGYIDRQVAKMLGISTVAVCKIRRKLNLKPNRINKIETRTPRLVYNEDLYLLERRFGVKYRGRPLHHRPVIFTMDGKTILPSFYDSSTNTYIFLVSRQRWHQIQEHFLKIVSIFRANNFVLINNETLEEFKPTGKNIGYFKEMLHANYDLFVGKVIANMTNFGEGYIKKAS